MLDDVDVPACVPMVGELLAAPVARRATVSLANRTVELRSTGGGALWAIQRPYDEVRTSTSVLVHLPIGSRGLVQ